jgi:5'-deoxynucleotidase YfbR-like HD superfamily hydrolase
VLVEGIASHVNRQMDKPARLMALLHDAPEYVVGDMISPFKAALGVDYRVFEERLEHAIHLRFGLPARTPPAVKALIKQADRACAFFEATQLAGFEHAESLDLFDAPPPGYSLRIEPQPASEAQAHYLRRFEVLSDAAGFRPHALAFDTE